MLLGFRESVAAVSDCSAEVLPLAVVAPSEVSSGRWESDVSWRGGKRLISERPDGLQQPLLSGRVSSGRGLRLIGLRIRFACAAGELFSGSQHRAEADDEINWAHIGCLVVLN